MDRGDDELVSLDVDARRVAVRSIDWLDALYGLARRRESKWDTYLTKLSWASAPLAERLNRCEIENP